MEGYQLYRRRQRSFPGVDHCAPFLAQPEAWEILGTWWYRIKEPPEVLVFS
jgi:hypothetical protein